MLVWNNETDRSGYLGLSRGGSDLWDTIEAEESLMVILRREQDRNTWTIWWGWHFFFQLRNSTEALTIISRKHSHLASYIGFENIRQTRWLATTAGIIKATIVASDNVIIQKLSRQVGILWYWSLRFRHVRLHGVLFPGKRIYYS